MFERPDATSAAFRADVRDGVRWKPAQRLKNDLIFAAVRAALAVLCPLPPAALRALGRALALAALGAFPSARRTAWRNLGRVFPQRGARERAALLVRCYVCLGAQLGNTLALLDGRRPLAPLRLAPDALDVLAGARAEGRGVIFASAHLGPWEHVAATLAAHGVPLTVLARESYDPRFDALYGRLRQDRGLEAIYRGQPGAPVRIVRTLRQGRVLGIPMDLTSRVASVRAAFLGHLAPTPVGPARIALRQRAPVVVGTVAPDPRGGLELTMTRIATEDLERGDAGERTLVMRINAELSRRILALPHAWVWMHPRW